MYFGDSVTKFNSVRQATKDNQPPQDTDWYRQIYIIKALYLITLIPLE